LTALVIGLVSPTALAGTFSPATRYPVGNSPRSTAVADFNGDSHLDLAVANFFGDNVSILLGAPGGTFGAATNFPAGIQPRSIAGGDFNGDSDPDLAVANAGSDNVSILLGGPGGTFTGPTNFPAGSGPNCVAVSDFNDDGQPDLAVTDWGGGVSILLGASGGTFAAPTGFLAGTNPMSVAVDDYDGDSRPDLAVANYGSDNVSILIGAPGGAFGLPVDFPAGINPRAMTVGEFNGDSDPDLAVANLTGETVSILLGAAGGAFGAPTDFPAEDPNSIAVGDFNEDAQPDLAVAQYYTRDVTILVGEPGGTFTGPLDFAVGRVAFSVGVSDFNADSRDDLVITNYGFNAVSILTGGPITVAAGDVSKPEGDTGPTEFGFTVPLSGPNTDPVTVDYQTADGSATAGSDYTAASGTLTIPAGQTSGAIPVQVSGDLAFEPNEDFSLALSNPTPADASLAKDTGVGTIENDDQPGFPRPRAATPLYTPLVVAYGSCAVPNRAHADPLAYGSCDPPAPSSQYVSVGTPDANGNAANAAGAARYSVLLGDPATPADEADVKLNMSMTDVREQATLDDYTGELWTAVNVRLTDRLNVAPSTPQTVSDFEFGFAVPCAATVDSAIGSTCSLDTTADAILPGAVPERGRTIWELGQTRVQDGGEDGQGATTADNTLFLAQGIFVP
jgi:predicted NUDIX family NTP pyrophosphohydrolase